MFKKIALIAATLLVSASALATPQGVPGQAVLDNQVKFGYGSVDLTHARIVDATPNNQKITDANGVVRTGSFASSTVFANHPAYKQYIRVYNGANVFYNASMFTAPECVNGSTRLTWINSVTPTDIADGCQLYNAVLTWARNF